MAKTPARKFLPVEKLDPTRPYGAVYGEHEHNIAFEQKALGIQSWPYDAQGILIEPALNEKQREKLAALRRAAAKREAEEAANPKKEVVADESDEDSEEATELEDGERDGVTDRKGGDDDDVNLVMWLKGELRLAPFQTQNALKARYGVNKPKQRDAALYLVEEQHLLPRDQVHSSILPKLQK